MKNRTLALWLILTLLACTPLYTAIADGDSTQTVQEELIEIVPADSAVIPDAGYQIGGTICFGTYEQDGNPYNGAEPIEWQILEAQGNRLMLITRHGIAGLKYNEQYAKASWDTSTIRAWLNGEFLNSAFTDAERMSIELTWVDNSAYQHNRSWTSAKTGENTQDKVFLLSWSEAERYFPGDSARICWMTNAAGTQRYAKAGDQAWWWLRSPGKSNLGASIVRANGSLSSQHINEPTGAIRPVIWVMMDTTIY